MFFSCATRPMYSEQRPLGRDPRPGAEGGAVAGPKAIGGKPGRQHVDRRRDAVIEQHRAHRLRGGDERLHLRRTASG